jgi:hypothetical protein
MSVGSRSPTASTTCMRADPNADENAKQNITAASTTFPLDRG